jgi:hypothetical protein
MVNIFISYRRNDAGWAARSLRTELVKTFKSEQIFMDIDNIITGENFVTVIEEAINKCQVILVVIGNNWINSQSAAKTSLWDENDFVRLEIETGLLLNKRVIPVIVDNAKIPSEEDLPETLKGLARRNARLIRLANSGSDIQALVDDIRFGKAPLEESLSLKDIQTVEELVKRAIELNALQRAKSKILSATVERHAIDDVGKERVWVIEGSFKGAAKLIGEWQYDGRFKAQTLSSRDIGLWHLSFTSFWEKIRFQGWVPVKQELIAQANGEFVGRTNTL